MGLTLSNHKLQCLESYHKNHSKKTHCVSFSLPHQRGWRLSAQRWVAWEAWGWQVTMGFCPGKGGLGLASCVFMLYDRFHTLLSVLTFMLITFSRAKICLYFSS